MGIAISIDITCSRCGEIETVSPVTSNYANTNMKGNISLQKNVIGTI